MTEQPVETMQFQEQEQETPHVSHYVCFDCPEITRIGLMILMGRKDLPEVKGICGSVVPWSEQSIYAQGPQDHCVICLELVDDHRRSHGKGSL